MCSPPLFNKLIIKQNNQNVSPECEEATQNVFEFLKKKNMAKIRV